MFALAKTGDSRAVASLQLRLAADAEDVFLLEIRSAAEIADPQLHPLLVSLGQDWVGDDDDFTPALAFATSRCRPEAKAQAAMVESKLVARVNTLLAGRGLTVTLVGDYPHTALTFHRVEDPSSPVVLDAIWTEDEPWGYPLEQMAQSFVMSYANDTGDE